jgi:secondary thiamine-phosphate synthase enzyme
MDQAKRNRLQWRDRVGIAPTSRNRRGTRQLQGPEYSRVASGRCFFVTLSVRVRTLDRAIYRANSEGERMSKSSTVTVREKPVEGVATATVGGVTIHGETFVIDTDQRVELVDLTNRIMDFVRRFNVSEGLISIWSMHTTCTLLINEFQVALLSDIKKFLEQMVARDAEYMHNDPNHSDCDRMNADSHLRAMLLGHSLALQISGGEVVLGQWQRILMAELDGPRARSLRVQIFGVS